MQAFDNRSIDELLLRLLENSIEPADFARLEQWMAVEPGAADYYCRFIRDYSAIKMGVGSRVDEATLPLMPASGQEILRSMAQVEQVAPPLQKPAGPPALTPAPSLPARNQQRISFKTLIPALISGAALIMALLLLDSYSPRRLYSVATVTETMQPRWQDEGAGLKKDDRLFNRKQPFELAAGLIKIKFDNHAEVIIEGPASFSCVSPEQLCLLQGQVFCHVPQAASGFMVRTPTSRVIDLGTEFGIQVRQDGATDVHMFRGKANLIAGDAGKTLQQALLAAGDARRIQPGSGQMEIIPPDTTAFVQQFNSQSSQVWKGQVINLAGLVAGGNGFNAGEINRGINLKTGEYQIFKDITTSQQGTVGYREVSVNPYVDGVFIPDGRNGPVQITSTGLMFDVCPVTSGSYWGGPFNGAWHGSTAVNVPKHQLGLAGVTYGTVENPALYMHANQGITFDLRAIEQAHPGLRAAEFRAICGISETILNYPQVMSSGSVKGIPRASCCVLADGKVIDSHEDTQPGQSQAIQVVLPVGTRFLTLITTQGSDGNIYNDWMLFGRPELVLDRMDAN